MTLTVNLPTLTSSVGKLIDKGTPRSFNMDEMTKHLIERLTEVEEGLRELREVTWPVCQGLLDKTGPFTNRQQKRRFFRFLERGEATILTRLKEAFMGRSQDLVVAELQWVLVEEPRVPEE